MLQGTNELYVTLGVTGLGSSPPLEDSRVSLSVSLSLRLSERSLRITRGRKKPVLSRTDGRTVGRSVGETDRKSFVQYLTYVRHKSQKLLSEKKNGAPKIYCNQPAIHYGYSLLAARVPLLHLQEEQYRRRSYIISR